MSTRTLARPRFSSPILTADGRLLPTNGPAVCDWIESNCVYGEGDYFGQPARLRDLQREIFYRLYEFYPEIGRRRYKRALIGMGKGGGKTPIAAWTGSVEGFAGLNVAPRVMIGAASLANANTVFQDVAVSFDVEKNPLSILPLLAVGTDLQITSTDGAHPATIQRLAAVAGANDGPRATTFIADELHEWLGRLARVFTVVEGAVAKRANGFLLAITTAGVDDDTTLVKQLYDYGVKVSTGEITDDEFLFMWWEADPGLDLDDPAQLLEAIYQANPFVGDLTDPEVLALPERERPFTDLNNILGRFRRLPRHEFRRYHLNQFVSTGEVWEVAGWWDRLRRPRVRLDPAHPIFVGIDIGIRHDSAAVEVAQLQPRKGRPSRVVTRSRIWQNPFPPTDRRHAEWTLPVHEVKDHLRGLSKAFPKRARKKRGPAYFYDPTYFEDGAQDLEAERLNMLEYDQTDARMIPASQTLFRLVKEQRIAHEGDPTLARQMRNVIPHLKARGWRISKPKGSPNHIDGPVALAIATHEATRSEWERAGVLLTVAEAEGDESS